MAAEAGPWQTGAARRLRAVAYRGGDPGHPASACRGAGFAVECSAMQALFRPLLVPVPRAAALALALALAGCAAPGPAPRPGEPPAPAAPPSLGGLFGSGLSPALEAQRT